MVQRPQSGEHVRESFGDDLKEMLGQWTARSVGDTQDRSLSEVAEAFGPMARSTATDHLAASARAPDQPLGVERHASRGAAPRPKQPAGPGLIAR